ncbi:hypothetical protein BLS_000681 [Venturia inaequalis]|uniref:Uncharacterized protein n=1 Tax=Venturia inaequalis TaxID=5025 RepID=A0A8H3UXH5_VENIN|nr:hypothetical protein BLS_000681 [Venturia inaequalis]
MSEEIVYSTEYAEVMSRNYIPSVDSHKFIHDPTTIDFFPLDETMAVKFIEGLTTPMLHPATPDDRPVVGHEAGEQVSAATICMPHQVTETWRNCRELLGWASVAPIVMVVSLLPFHRCLLYGTVADFLVTFQEGHPREKAMFSMIQQAGMAGKAIQDGHTPEESQAIAKGIVEFVRAKASASPEIITSREDYEDMKLAIRADSAFQWLMEFSDQKAEGFNGSVVVKGIVAFINRMKVLDEEKKDKVVEAFMVAYKPVVFAE